MTPQQRIDRSVNAKAVLENPAYQEAVSKILQDLRSLRLQLSPKDQEGCARLVQMEQAVEKAKRLMEMYLEDAEAAKKELQTQERPGPVGRLNRRFQQVIGR